MDDQYPIEISSRILDALHARGWLYDPPKDIARLSPDLQRIYAYVQAHPNQTTQEIAGALARSLVGTGAQLQRLAQGGYVESIREVGKQGRKALWSVKEGG